LGGPDYVIQLSDRQLTAVGGRILPTENKATLLTCRDARLLVGFTALARAGRFRTAEWLLEAFLEAAPPDDLAEAVVKRFVEVANEQFRVPAIKSLAPTDRRSSIMFTGYAYWTDPPLVVGALVSNYQDFTAGVDRAQPWEEFRHWFLREKRPWVDEPAPTYMQRLGAWSALAPRDLEPLREMLQQRRPSAALVGKAVEIMRTAADHPAAHATVGRDLTSAVLRPDPRVAPDVQYHVLAPAHEIPLINQAILLGDESRVLVRDGTLALDPSTGPPIAVQKVGRNPTLSVRLP
jgi:hypothetical protein